MRKLVFLGFMIYVSSEVAILIQAGRIFGLGWVMAWVALTIVLGVGVLRTQGIFSLRRVTRQLAQEVLPTRELVDLSLVLIASALLISPGLLADLAGLLLLIPVFRISIRRMVLHFLPRWVPEEVPQARLRAAASNVIEIERDPHG